MKNHDMWRQDLRELGQVSHVCMYVCMHACMHVCVMHTLTLDTEHPAHQKKQRKEPRPARAGTTAAPPSQIRPHIYSVAPDPSLR